MHSRDHSESTPANRAERRFPHYGCVSGCNGVKIAWNHEMSGARRGSRSGRGCCCSGRPPPLSAGRACAQEPQPGPDTRRRPGRLGVRYLPRPRSAGVSSARSRDHRGQRPDPGRRPSRGTAKRAWVDVELATRRYDPLAASIDHILPSPTSASPVRHIVAQRVRRLGRRRVAYRPLLSFGCSINVANARRAALCCAGAARRPGGNDRAVLTACGRGAA